MEYFEIKAVPLQQNGFLIERDFPIAMYYNADVAFWFIQFYYNVSKKRVPLLQWNETLSVGLFMNS